MIQILKKCELLKLIFCTLCLFKTVNAADEVCYPNIGCFEQSYPWVSMMSRPFPPPDSPDNINITLIYFNRDETQGQRISIYPDIDLDSLSGFKPNQRMVTITHGFASSANADWVLRMKDKYLDNINANIFLVDWSHGADTLNYFQAAANTRVVGAVLGRFGNYLINNTKAELSSFHLIGHSLGAHISGYAAARMNNASTTGQKVYRITGLDAAQPGFQSEPSEVRLSKDNAEFVECIHSDATPFIPFFGLGYLTDLGHVDIYLNRGYNQPRCIDFTPKENLTSVDQIATHSADIIARALSCSHGRAYEVFISSMDKSVKCEFVGHKLISWLPIISDQYLCGDDDCIKVGLDTPNQKARGSFQLMTSGEKPFCCYGYSMFTGCKSSPEQEPSMFRYFTDFILG